MNDIKNYSTFKVIKPVDKGMSNDKKYYIETTVGKRLLLRITDIREYDRKKAEYRMNEQVYELGVLTPKPYDFGVCDNGKSVYSLTGWLDSEGAEIKYSLKSK